MRHCGRVVKATDLNAHISASGYLFSSEAQVRTLPVSIVLLFESSFKFLFCLLVENSQRERELFICGFFFPAGWFDG